jgi:hypothetical protein
MLLLTQTTFEINDVYYVHQTTQNHIALLEEKFTTSTETYAIATGATKQLSYLSEKTPVLYATKQATSWTLNKT